MDSTINKTNELLNFVMQDKEALRAYHMREMAMSDWTTGVNTALEKQAVEIARKMKARGRPFEEIVEDTGLDIETIQSLPLAPNP
jgi:hypothetical protein